MSLDPTTVDPQLVRTIVEKVIQALGRRHDGQWADQEALHRDQGPEIYILERRDKVDETALKALVPANSRLVFLADCNCPIARGREYDRILLPRLEMGLLADLALGRARGTMAGGILNLLMGGRTIEVVSYGHERHAATAPPALMALYRGYARTLEGFGMVPLSRAKAGKAGGHFPHLITEAYVAGAAARGERCLELPRRTLVTALAQDLAREKGIEIRRNHTPTSHGPGDKGEKG